MPNLLFRLQIREKKLHPLGIHATLKYGIDQQQSVGWDLLGCTKIIKLNPWFPLDILDHYYDQWGTIKHDRKIMLYSKAWPKVYGVSSQFTLSLSYYSC